MADRPERRVLEGGGALHGRRGADAERQLRFVDLEARYEGAEVKGRRDVAWNVDRALFFVAREVLVRGIDHRLELCFTEFQAGEQHRVGDHGQRDSFLARVLHAGPENARRERRAQTEACKVRDESSARFIQVGHVDPRVLFYYKQGQARSPYRFFSPPIAVRGPERRCAQNNRPLEHPAHEEPQAVRGENPASH